MIIDFETSAKLFIAITGLITVIVKFVDSFSETRRKNSLKTDLELLEKLNSENLNVEDKAKINNQIKVILEEYFKIKETTFKLFDIFYALTLFVGFGWWTVYIYETSHGFSPWTILTGLISFLGLGILIDGRWIKKSVGVPLITIVVYKGIHISIILIGLSTLTGLYIWNIYKSYTNWFIPVGVVLTLGVKSFYDSVKIRK